MIRVKSVWQKQTEVLSVDKQADQTFVFTQEGLVLVVKPEPSSFMRHKLRGKVTDIAVAPHGVNCGKFFDREVCCYEEDGLTYLCTMEDATGGK